MTTVYIATIQIDGYLSITIPTHHHVYKTLEDATCGILKIIEDRIYDSECDCEDGRHVCPNNSDCENGPDNECCCCYDACKLNFSPKDKLTEEEGRKLLHRTNCRICFPQKLTLKEMKENGYRGIKDYEYNIVSAPYI